MSTLQGYDVGHDDEGFYLIMELLRGRSLADRLVDGPMSAEEFVPILEGVCSGLEAAHRAGVVHRDLKPENIFLAEARNHTGDIVPKIVDFGVSKGVSASTSTIRMTNAGVAMGTPYYMSPEQFRSAKDVDLRTDIYSLGVIAYEALSGVVPHEGETASAIVIKVATEEPTPLLERIAVQQPLASAVHRALSKDAAMRQTSAMQFFDEVSRGSMADIRLPMANTVAAPDSEAPPPARSRIDSDPVVLPTRSSGVGKIVAASLVALLLLGLTLAFWPDGDPAPTAASAPAPASHSAETPESAAAPPPAATPGPAAAATPVGEAIPNGVEPPAPTMEAPTVVPEAARTRGSAPRGGRVQAAAPRPAMTPTAPPPSRNLPPPPGAEPAATPAAIAAPTATMAPAAAVTAAPVASAMTAPAPPPPMAAPSPPPTPMTTPMRSQMVGRLGVEVTNEGF